MNVIASIVVLGLLIFFHESGHFLAAKLQGIRVSGFSIGFGPAIIKKKFKDVTYSIRALPLGGFVSFPDAKENQDISPEDPNLLGNRPIHQRLFVISAGVIANLLIAWMVLFCQGAFIGLPSEPEPGVLIMSIQQEGAAAKAGLAPGDKILSINGESLGSGKEAVQSLVRQIQGFPGEILNLERISNNKKSIVEITPINYLGQGKVGAQLQQNISESTHKASGLKEVLIHTSNQFLELLGQTIKGYKGLITDFSSTSKQMSGPVKIVEIGAQFSSQGISGLLLFAALISINLAVLNSLPFPLLDGGQFTLILIEGIRGKPIPEKIQLAFMQSGFIILVGLSLVLIIRDTTQLNIFKQISP